MSLLTTPFLLILFVLPSHAQRQSFDTIVCFGDSNSDTGKVYNLTAHAWPIVPPYFEGRFSNGPVWIEKLGIAELDNYAFGGATTDDNLIPGYTAADTLRVPGVRQQIQMYLKANGRKNTNWARTLHAIWVGGNDYYFNETLTPSMVASSILNGVNDLIRIGAKHILVVNQPPMQIMPFIQSPAQADYFKRRTLFHNGNLSMGMTKLDYDRATISLHLLDVYSLVLNSTILHPNPSLNASGYCWHVADGKVTLLCSDAESYVYIDQYHFGARMHALIGTAARQLLSISSGECKHSFSVTVLLGACFFLMWTSEAT